MRLWVHLRLALPMRVHICMALSKCVMHCFAVTLNIALSLLIGTVASVCQTCSEDPPVSFWQPVCSMLIAPNQLTFTIQQYFQRNLNIHAETCTVNTVSPYICCCVHRAGNDCWL